MVQQDLQYGGRLAGSAVAAIVLLGVAVGNNFCSTVHQLAGFTSVYDTPSTCTGASGSRSTSARYFGTK